VVERLLRHLPPWVALGGAASAALAHALGLPMEGAVTAWSLAVLALGVTLERWRPAVPAWRQAQGDGATDGLSAAVLLGLVEPALKTLWPLVAVLAWAAVPTLAQGWPNDWPLPLQAALALGWMELAAYAAHRAHHRWRPLWRLHALHHSSTRLYWLNNFRFHPLNHALNAAVSLLPLVLLGAPAEAVTGALAVSLPVLMLQHLNAELRLAPVWNRVFSTHEAHRWHHSALPEEAHANYGRALLLWDHVFGTYLAPGPARAPARLGLFRDGDPVPSRAPYWRQLLGGCCAA
jgi:sterol desaturase/sphingolipid hydroxylase (fatty acid hydroxylase superfamily)